MQGEKDSKMPLGISHQHKREVTSAFIGGGREKGWPEYEFSKR